jgi:hypothetical protein
MTPRHDGRSEGAIMRKKMTGLWTLVAMLLAVAPVQAGIAIDWDPAYFWQTGATPTNAPAGGELKAVGIVSDFGPPLDFLDASDPTKEYTFYIYGLISQGTVATGPPTTTFYATEYTGGFIELYEDTSPESSFDPNPPNATVPSNYTDGTLLLSGYFTSFRTQTNNFTAFSVGNAEGIVVWTGGSLLELWTNNVGEECPGLFNGGTTWNSSVVPAGYLFRHDGKLDLNCYDVGDLDIHPTSCPSPVNAGGNGLIPVALLGSESFDISKVELSSLRLQGLEPVKIMLGDVSQPVVDRQDECDCTTAGPDGYDDLLLKFDTQQLIGLLEPIQPGETRVLTLTGNLYDNGFVQTFTASDCVTMIDNSTITTAPAAAALEVTMPGAGLVPARIDYTLPQSGPVQISVLDVSGRTVARVLNGWGNAGAHTIEWAPRGLPSGIYFIRMVAGEETRVRRVALTF